MAIIGDNVLSIHNLKGFLSAQFEMKDMSYISLVLRFLNPPRAITCPKLSMLQISFLVKD